MQEAPETPMEGTCKILRRSIYSFLGEYQYFTSTAATLAFPFSLSLLLSQAVIPSSYPFLPSIQNRLQTLFDAAGFPSSSGFFRILSLKLSQTLSSSFLTLPFTLTFLLFAKAAVIQVLKHEKRSLPYSSWPFLSLYNPLLSTYVCNSLLILSANATAFALLFLAFNSFQGFGFVSGNSTLILSASGAVLYSIILANALTICNLGLVLSGMEKRGGFSAILRACVLLKGRTSTALSLAISVNLAMAACEALFQYRIVRDFRSSGRPFSSMALEGVFIAYLYSILLVIDTIVSCLLFKSCKKDFINDRESFSYQIVILGGDDDRISGRLRRSEVLLKA